MRHAAIKLALLTMFLPAAITGFAQEVPPPNEEAAIKQVVDGIMQPYLSQQNLPGAIVGVSLHGHRYVFHYGQATDSGEPFSPDTIVEIGSCTKVFTTALFALAINRKQIDPNAPAQKYMPSGYTLQPAAQAMTPLNLADFTSGMPDDPTNFPPVLERRGLRFYTVKDFLSWVSHWRPREPIPAPYKYSNAGIGLLSYLVETATGASWESQLNTEILQPLGMTSTALRLTPEQRQRLAKGHRPNGTDAPPWPISAWYAAGDLRSTAGDMLSFGEANLGHKEVNGRPVPPELTAAMQLAQKPIYTLPNGRNQQAMAWFVNMGNGGPKVHPVIVKNGGTDGFSSAITLNPFKDLVVFVVVNHSRALPTRKAVEISRHIRVVNAAQDSD